MTSKQKARAPYFEFINPNTRAQFEEKLRKLALEQHLRDTDRGIGIPPVIDYQEGK